MLKNKIAIVTGSSRGFGAAIAKELTHNGIKTVITYFDGDDKEKKNAYELSTKLSSDLVVPLDVRSRESVKTLFSKVSKFYNGIDILVNNAGINIEGDFDQISDDDWQAVIDVDLKGVFICSQEINKYINENGRIINIGSVSGQYGGPRTPSYAVAKAGVISLTHGFARYFGKRNITVNCVSPGPIKSEMLSRMPDKLLSNVLDMTLLNRLGMVGEVSKTVSFLCQPGSGYITGQNIAVNGGVWV